MKSRFQRFAALLLAGGLCGVLWLARAYGGNSGNSGNDAAVKDDVIPKGYAVDRYAPLWEHSPFALASVQQETVQASFSQNFAVVGLAKVGNEDLVTVVNKQSMERITLDSTPNAQGIKVVAVESADDVTKLKVTLQKGNETGTITFDRSLLAAGQGAATTVQNSPGTVSPVLGGPNPTASNMPPIPTRKLMRPPPLPTPRSASAASSTQ